MVNESGWTEEDDALLKYEQLPPWHPALFVDVFRTLLAAAPLETTIQIAEACVTPESLESWGDLSRARAIFDLGLKISMTPLYIKGAPDVAYIRLVETDRHASSALSTTPATAHFSLVWRPEIAVIPGTSWRAHHLGDPVGLTLLPRSSTTGPTD